MDVYIVGVNHRIQWWPSSPGAEWTKRLLEFQGYLEDACGCLQIELLAEELNEEALRISNSRRCTGQSVANSRGISHRFCDPDSKERNSLGVSCDEQRMRIWLQRIVAAEGNRVLFLCGDDHVGEFATLLQKEGHQVQTLSQGWGRNWELVD
jgi:hypothetical protein